MVTFTEEIFREKLHLLCSGNSEFTSNLQTLSDESYCKRAECRTKEYKPSPL